MSKIITILALIIISAASGVSAESISLKSALVEYVTAHSRWPGAVVTVDNIELHGDVLAKDEVDALRVTSRNGARTTGRVSFNVSLLRGGRTLRTVVAVADVGVMRSVVVAAAPLKMRVEITPKDVRLELRDILKIPVNSAVFLDDVVGKAAKRPIQAGRIVRSDYLLKALLVRRGQGLDVRGAGGPIIIRSRATAITGGVLGSRIKARTAGGREIFGQVSGRGQIVVELN